MFAGYIGGAAASTRVTPFGLFSASLAQTVADSGEIVGDINAPDPELLPREEKFKHIEVDVGHSPDYRYAALKTPSSIRLLELWSIKPPESDVTLGDRAGYSTTQQGNSHKNIWCRIVQRDLSESSRPEYETISYTWAGLPKCIPIFIDGGKVICINAPIYTCLQRLEIGPNPRYLWIDQICIYSHRTAMKHPRNLRLMPRLSEGFNFYLGAEKLILRAFNIRLCIYLAKTSSWYLVKRACLTSSCPRGWRPARRS